MRLEVAVDDFLMELNGFDYELFVMDRVWKLIFPDRKGKWNYVTVVKDRQTYYFHHIDGKYCSLEVIPGKTVKPVQPFGSSSYPDGSDDPGRVWLPIIANARAWLRSVKRNWIKVNQRMQQQCPKKFRFGIAPNSLIRASFSDFYRIDNELGKARRRIFICLVEDRYFMKDKNIIRETMTAGDFFEYCRIAYISGKRKEDQVDMSLSGRQMYQRYADGRHEGLLDINEKSEQEFADWIDGKHPKRTTGGHPWEIKRGGNTTHIDLSVSRPRYSAEKGFKVELRGRAISRLKETIQMFLGIHKASLPISIDDPEGIRKRLLAQDNIGIIPAFDSLHRANQHFKEEQSVYDVMYYDDLGRFKTRINPFIVWEPLPVLKPKDF